MSYCSVTFWDCTEWSDAMEAVARDTFVPMILAVGASSVDMVRTGDLQFCVFTKYADAKTAEAAQAKIADIRAKAANELPMTLASALTGQTFAQG